MRDRYLKFNHGLHTLSQASEEFLQTSLETKLFHSTLIVSPKPTNFGNLYQSSQIPNQRAFTP